MENKTNKDIEIYKEIMNLWKNGYITDKALEMALDKLFCEVIK